MAFCKNCNADGGNGAFCANCGSKFEGNAVPASGTKIAINNFFDNQNILKTQSAGCFDVYEYQKDLSVHPAYAHISYFMEKTNFRKRQVLCKLENSSVKIHAGSMQWIAGKVAMDADVKGVGDFFSKALKGAATGETLAKPVYQGTGYVMLEPTYRYIIIEDLANWGSGMVLDDGMFLACDSSVKEEMVSRTNVSSALLGGEGWFNLSLSGNGIAVLESSVPRDELVEIVLDNDEVRIDGNMAVAWSKSLEFSVEKSSKSVLGSLISGEGFVNVYRGTGKVLMAPIVPGTLMTSGGRPQEAVKTTSNGLLSSVKNTLF